MGPAGLVDHSPRDRAVRLLAEIHSDGWVIEFVERHRSGRVHVAAVDSDQNPVTGAPITAGRVRTVCGRVIGRKMYGKVAAGIFPDERLCRACWSAFPPGDRPVLSDHTGADRRNPAANDAIRQRRGAR